MLKLRHIFLKCQMKFVVMAAFLVISIFTASTVYGEDYKVSDYTINSTLKSNGDMHVEEFLTYKFDASMNGVYRDILYKYTFNNQADDMNPTSSRYQAEGIKNIEVYTSNYGFDSMSKSYVENESNLQNGMSGAYSLTDSISNGNRLRIKAYSPAEEGSYKYIKYVYDVENVAATYSDGISEVYWNFVGKDWQCEIDNLEVNISFENTVQDSSIKLYPHSYADIYESNINDGKITFKVKNIGSGTAVDSRIVVPFGVIYNYSKEIKNNYDYNLLGDIENKMAIDKQKYHYSNILLFCTIILSIVSIIYIIVLAVKNASTGKKSLKKVDYTTYIPDKYSLGEYKALQGWSIGFLDPQLLLATILDLSSRKYIIMDAQKKVKKIAFDNVEYDYYMTINENMKVGSLNSYEITVLNWIFNEGLTDTIDLDKLKGKKVELNKRFKEIGSKYKETMAYRKLCKKYNSDYTEKMYEKPPKKLYNVVLWYILIISVLTFANVFFVSPSIMEVKIPIVSVSLVMLFITAVMMSLIVYSSRKLKPEYIDGYNELLGLRRYLRDYSLIKERYPIEVVLWERYLVFATLFGIAQKVAKEFKEELIKQGYDNHYIYVNYPVLNVAVNSYAISSAVAASTGTSSSGGYSGGGSGGGGGGRRWRRRILKLKNLLF